MDRRLKQFSEARVRDIRAYNEKLGFEALPHILIITFLDVSALGTEYALVILTAQGIRTGIHNIIVVDRTRGASLPTMLKSNIPARVAFRLTSAEESRAKDAAGAEELEPGVIIYKPNYGTTEKLKAVFTPETNVKEVVAAVKKG